MDRRKRSNAFLSGKKYPFIRLLFVSLVHFRQKNPLMLASSTSFFTLFALPPILIILIQVLEGVVNPKVFKGELFAELDRIFGRRTEQTIKVIFTNFQNLPENMFATIMGFLFMIFVATTLFDLIKRSLHVLWSVNTPPKKTLLLQLWERGVSLALIIAGGVIFLFSLAADQSVVVLQSSLNQMKINPIFIIKTISTLLSIQLIAFWFGLVFKLLPNVHISWKPALIGGLFTSLLFAIGKYLLRKILVDGNINAIFGTSGSVVLFLLFIFYSALIFYYGAMFTKNFAAYSGNPIKV